MNDLLAAIISDSLIYMNQGGYVLWPLLAVSLWMWYLIVKKWVEIYRWRRLKFGDARLSGMLSSGQDVPCFFLTGRETDLCDHRFLPAFIQREKNTLEQHVQTIFILAAVSPLLGLLGTVTGMISTFEAISRFGTANVRAMAAGISEALITTQAGLAIAIPGLFMGHFIRRRADAIQMRMERFLLKTSAGEEASP
jgi:biopolymer transport protein ExbB